MLARLRSEYAYLSGMLRALRRTKPITANPTKTIGDYLDEWARRYADRPALANDSESYTYAALNARANAYARWALDQNLTKGDAVALMMPNRPEYLAIWFGLTRVGIAVALINTNLSGAALAHCVNAINMKAAIVDARSAAAFASARASFAHSIAVWSHGDAANDDPRLDLAIAEISGAPLEPGRRPEVVISDDALYIYTSGTTGKPKAARITHSRVLRVMIGVGSAVNGRADDRVYLFLPLYHTNGGLIAPGAALPFGGSCYIRERFSASGFWNDIVRERCTLFIYVGEICRYLYNAPASPAERAHKLRACVGNGLRSDIFAAFQQRFAIPQIIEFYASTEGNLLIINLDSRPGAIGRIPAWARRRFLVKIVAYDHEANTQKRDAHGRCIECKPGEAGELISQINNDPKMLAARFDGYADPAATRQKVLRDVFEPGDAWFRSGDLVRQDSDGYFYFVDRVGDTFRWKGENVSTIEVAETLARFSGVREAVVYGVAVPGHDGRAGMAALVVDWSQLSISKVFAPSSRNGCRGTRGRSFCASALGSRSTRPSSC